MLKFLLTPRWIALTVLFALSLPAFDALSQWQWRRLHERQVHNSLILKAEHLPVTSIMNVLSDQDSADHVLTFKPGAEWRNVSVTGTWDEKQQVLVRKKSLESELGFWVMTPLKLSNGSFVLINRGWTAATAAATQSPTLTAAPVSQVTITGRVRIVEQRTQSRPTDLPTGQVDTIVPTEVITHGQVVSNGYLEMTASSPISLTSELRELPAPELSEGSHRSYALQWIAFAVMTLIGWGVLVRNEYLHRKMKQAPEHNAAASTEDYPSAPSAN